MLERLEALAGADRRVAESMAARDRDPSRVMDAVERALRAQPEVFAEAVAQLTAPDVQGCAPEQVRADEARARGNAQFQKGQYGAAVVSYTEALQHQQALNPTARAAASRLFSNRAAALLRLAACPPASPTGPSPPPSTSPSSGAGPAPDPSSTSTLASTATPAAAGPATAAAAAAAGAALADAQCAVRADPTFAKAHYRAACARRVLGDPRGALADCRKAVGAGGGGAAAAGGRNGGAGTGGQGGAGDTGGGGRRGTGTGGGGGSAAAVQVDEAAALLTELQLEVTREGERGRKGEGRRSGGSGSSGSSGDGGSHEAMQAAGDRECCDAGSAKEQVGRGTRPAVSATDPRVVEDSSIELGRHLILDPAAPPLPPATDILYDWPLAAVLCKRWRRRGGGGSSGTGSSQVLRCWRCTAALQEDDGAVMYPCLYCPMAMYCSPYCRDHDLFHVPGGCECGLPWAHLLPEEAVLACRLVRRAAAEAVAVAEAVADADAATSSVRGAAGGAPGKAVGAEGPLWGAAGVRTRLAAAAATGDPQLTPGSSAAREVLGKLLAHSESRDPADLLRTAVLAATTAAAYRSACHAALRRWLKQKLQPLEAEEEEEEGAEKTAGQAMTATTAAAAAAARCELREEVERAAPEARDEGRSGRQLAQQEQPQQQGQGRSEGRRQLRWLTGAVPVEGLRPPEVTAAELFAAICRVRVNGIAVRPDATTSASDRLALALYPRAALLNHSCAPNLGLWFRGPQLVARTCRPVQPGQALTVSYGPQLGKAPFVERQRALRAQYAFTCRCEACTDPRVTGGAAAALEAALWGLKCPACSGPRDEPGRGLGPEGRDSGGGQSREDEATGATGAAAAAPCSPAGGAVPRRLPASLLPTDPRVAALCGGGGGGDAATAAAARARAPTSGPAGTACACCGAHLSAEQQQVAAEALAAADELAEQAAAVLEEEAPASGGGPLSPPAIALPPPPPQPATLLAAWRRLQHAAELRRRVLPDTNRLMGATLHQLGVAALKILRTAATAGAGAAAGPDGGAARQRPSAVELAELAADAAQYISCSLLALRLVYRSCSTEVLYELELLAQLLDEMPPPTPAAHLQSPSSAHPLTAQLQLTGPGEPLFRFPEEEEDHCPACGAAASAHEAAVHTRLTGLLTALCRSGGQRDDDDGGGGSGVSAAGGRDLRGAAAGLRGQVWELYGCLGWHLTGGRPPAGSGTGRVAA